MQDSGTIVTLWIAYETHNQMNVFWTKDEAVAHGGTVFSMDVNLSPGEVVVIVNNHIVIQNIKANNITIVK